MTPLLTLALMLSPGCPHADSLEAAFVLRSMAKNYRAEGYLGKAESVQLRVLKIVRMRLGEEDANVALALDGLGEIYFDQGRTIQARQTFEGALRIGQRTLDPQNPHLATILNDLGAANHRDGRWRDAAAFYRRALAIREAVDSEHADVTRANLAMLEKTLARR